MTQEISRWARANRKTNSGPEVRLRSILFHRGIRFRKNWLIRTAVLSVRPDIVFTRLRVAVFVDGCFWHGCPEHGGLPTSNRPYWEAKLYRNQNRDRRVDDALETAGWKVIRLWEHVEPSVAADQVIAFVMSIRSADAIKTVGNAETSEH